MEGCKVLSSNPVHSITARASGVFTNSYHPMVNTKGINVGNIATRHDARDSNRDARNGAVRYDVCLSSRSYEVKDVVGNIAIRNKESLVMTGRYVLTEDCKPKIYKKKEEFTVKTPVVDDFKSDSKEKFNPNVKNFVFAVNKNGYIPDNNGIFPMPGNPVHFSWSEVVKANSPLINQHKPNVKGRVLKGSYMKKYGTVPITEPNSCHCVLLESKGTEKNEFNPY